MKINLQTRLFPGYYGYNPMVSVLEYRAKKEEEAKKAAEEKAKQELIESLGNIKTFAIGTTPNFTIDLNKDMLQLDDIEQLIVTFGQFGRLVQREILYFSDNYKVDYELDSEGNYVPLSSSIVRDEKNIFNDEIQFMPTGFKDSEGNDIHRWRHPYQSIRNPKFTYDKIYNKLTLTLSQFDTLTHFKPTDWFYHKEDEAKPDLPYWKNNPSLVMIEVKIRVRRAIDNHFNEQVVIRPQEYYAVADTIEHTLRNEGPYRVKEDYKTAADPIYAIPRFNIYFDDYCEDESRYFLPDRVEDLKKHKLTTVQNLLRDGFRAISRPCYERDSEGNIVIDYSFDSEGIPVEKSRFWCLMLPIFAKIKVKDVKVMFGGMSTPGVSDNVDYDATGLHFILNNLDPNYNDFIELADSEGRVYWSKIKDSSELREKAIGEQWFDDLNRRSTPYVIPRPSYSMGETCTFHSDYVIDPDGCTPENPRGEYICWYICSKETVTGNISRFYGPHKYRKDQKHEPYYEFLIKFEEIKAGH